MNNPVAEEALGYFELQATYDSEPEIRAAASKAAAAIRDYLDAVLNSQP